MVGVHPYTCYTSQVYYKTRGQSEQLSAKHATWKTASSQTCYTSRLGKVCVPSQTKTKTVFSWNSRQHLFDSGGESHEWVASYALELTPLENAFNEAYGSRCISSMASTKWSGTRNTPLSEAPKSLAACLTCFREGMSLGLLKEDTRSNHTEEGISSSSCCSTRLIGSKLKESGDPLIATNLAASLSIHAMPTANPCEQSFTAVKTKCWVSKELNLRYQLLAYFLKPQGDKFRRNFDSPSEDCKLLLHQSPFHPPRLHPWRWERDSWRILTSTLSAALLST